MFKECSLIIQVILVFLLSVILSTFFNYCLIRLQKKKQFYQPIRDELQSLHVTKKNTPSLGGVAIISSVIISLLIVNCSIFLETKFLNLLFATGSFFLIGIIDDLIKLKSKDYHGEKAIIRILAEVLVSLIYLKNLGFNFVDFQYISIFNNTIKVGILALFFFSFLIVGSSNAMNLSDGLDGLASSLFLIALMPFTIYAFKHNIACGLFLLACFGSTIGFVIWNTHPSKIFMGDGGSLFLGAVLGCSAVLFHLESILFLSGAVLIIETLSVIIQVLYYKWKHKRVFLMAPLHHHFEMKGFSEEKVVLVFMIIGYIFSFLSVLCIL